VRDSYFEQRSWHPPALVAVKVLHTAIWVFFVACILFLPVCAWFRRFDWAAILTAFTLAECGVLAANHGRCPLTNLAARFTSDRREAFDIYLLVWLARWNKSLFGGLFLISELFVLWRWLR
jgi:hypothetical protein